MFAFGTKRTCQLRSAMSALGGKRTFVQVGAASYDPRLLWASGIVGIFGLFLHSDRA